MSVNILDLVKEAASDQIMSQIGGLLGQSDSKKTSSMFDTAVQSILGGMMKKSSTPEGAQNIFRAVQDQDDGLIDKLGDLLGGNGREAELEDAGSGVLDIVFGNNRGGLCGSIAKFLGLDDSIMGKLMTLAAPIVMGVVGKQVKNAALDAVGLGSLLDSQKQHLSSSMPAGLTNALGFGDLLGGGFDAVKDAGSAVLGAASNAGGEFADAVGNAGRAVAGATGDTGKAAMGATDDAVDAGSSLMKFLVPLFLLGAFAFLGYTIISGGFAGDEAAAATANLDDDAGDLGSLIPNGVDFGNFDMNGLQKKFSGIADGLKNVSSDSAEGLVDKITDLTGSIDSMGIDNLTGPAKSAASGIVGTFIENIQSSLDSMTDDGLLSMLKPIVNALIEKLNVFK